MSLSTGSKRRTRFHNDLMTDINVTPFVDVMLVLLVIFMVTAPMMTAGVQVDLPESAAKALPGQDEPLAVTIGSSGKIYVQKTEVPIKDLQAKLKAITGQKLETRIFVRGDKVVDYGLVMQVMGEINAAGFTKVGLVTEAMSTTATAKAR